MRACVNNYTYLECGSIKGEPIVGAGVWIPAGDELALAMSGCRKFRRWSTRSWCWARHRVRTSGNASSWSCKLFKNKLRFWMHLSTKRRVIYFETGSKFSLLKTGKRSNKVQWIPKPLFKSGLGLKVCNFSCRSTLFFTPIYQLVARCSLVAGFLCRRVSFVSTYKIYLHCIAQYFMLLLCIQIWSIHEASFRQVYFIQIFSYFFT